MSSDQILTAIAEIEHTTDAREIERAQVRAIAEVAYQLARLNERIATQPARNIRAFDSQPTHNGASRS